jgi:hypothetical protein
MVRITVFIPWFFILLVLMLLEGCVEMRGY